MKEKDIDYKKGVPTLITLGTDLKFDALTGGLKYGNKTVRLTHIESGLLLHFFIDNGENVPTRTEELYKRHWQDAEVGVGDQELVWVTVSRLREKIERIGLKGLIPTRKRGDDSYTLDLSILRSNQE